MSEFIYGRNAVLEALRAGHAIERILFAEGTRPSGPVAKIIGLARSRGMPVERAERRDLDALVHGHHQGVVGVLSPYRYASVQDMLALAKKREELPLLLILDCLQDVQNFGSLLRTAEAVGAHGVILPERRSVSVTAAVRKASAGAVEHLLVTRVTNLVRTMKELKERGIWIVGLEAGPEAQDYRQVDLVMPLALVVGSEGRGLGRLVRETCDFLIHLPTRGRINSLNAAVAGSIALYEAWMQRQNPGELRDKWTF